MKLFIAGCFLFASTLLLQLDSDVSAASLNVGSVSNKKVSELLMDEEKEETKPDDKRSDTPIIKWPKDEKTYSLMLMKLTSNRIPGKKLAKCAKNNTEETRGSSCKTHEDCLKNHGACKQGYKRVCQGKQGTEGSCSGECSDCYLACPDGNCDINKCERSRCQRNAECGSNGDLVYGIKGQICIRCKQ